MKEIKKTLNWEKLKPLLGGWSKYMQKWFLSEEAYNLFIEFKQIRDGGEQILPDNSKLFIPFSLCPPQNLKVIIISMDSYPGKYSNGVAQATGIPMCCENSPTDKIQPSLHSFYEGIYSEIGEEGNYPKSPKYLLLQGVLMLNRSLNVKYLKTGSLMGKWDGFYKYFFEQVITPFFNGIPIILLGKDAQVLKKYIFDMNNPVFCLSHPSYAARMHSTWETDGVFGKINKLIEINNGKEFCINWIKEPEKREVVINDLLPWDIEENV